jgi:YD repeat-containing protein
VAETRPIRSPEPQPTARPAAVVYDGLGRLCSQADPAGLPRTVYHYDSGGRLTSAPAATGPVTTFIYDGGRCTSLSADEPSPPPEEPQP